MADRGQATAVALDHGPAQRLEAPERLAGRTRKPYSIRTHRQPEQLHPPGVVLAQFQSSRSRGIRQPRAPVA